MSAGSANFYAISVRVQSITDKPPSVSLCPTKFNSDNAHIAGFGVFGPNFSLTLSATCLSSELFASQLPRPSVVLPLAL